MACTGGTWPVSASVSFIDQMWNSPQECIAPAEYNSSALKHLIVSICDLDTMDRTQPACSTADIDDASNCTRGRANTLALATPAATGRCCNVVRVAVNSSGSPIRYLQCRSDSSGMWIGAAAVAFAFIMLVFLCTAGVRRQRADRRRSQRAAEEMEMAMASGSASASSSATRHVSRQPLGARGLADALLHQMSGGVRTKRVARFAAAADRFGFQRDSALNQMRASAGLDPPTHPILAAHLICSLRGRLIETALRRPL